MFGEERVNNSIALLSRPFQLVKFQRWLLQFFKSMSIHKRRLCSRLLRQHGGPDGTVMQPSGLLVLFMRRAVTYASLA